MTPVLRRGGDHAVHVNEGNVREVAYCRTYRAADEVASGIRGRVVFVQPVTNVDGHIVYRVLVGNGRHS